MPKVSLDTSGRTWTYGAEHELADWDTRKGWEGFDRDPEPNIVNTNGIAADPRLISYKFGGEINTPPTNDGLSQADLLSKFLIKHPDSVANWRCGLHVHIRVPGLKENLAVLKKVARFIYQNRAVYDLVDPLPLPGPEHAGCYKDAKRRYNWMRMSHFTTIPEYRVDKQCKATSLDEFFNGEVPESREGKPLWHAQPRAAVNLRQLLQTDTIEFRHFPATLDPSEVIVAIDWCRDYLKCAFDGGSAVDLFHATYVTRTFPMLETIYCPWQESRWLATTVTKNKRSVAEANIVRFLADDEKGKRRGIDCY